MADCGEGNISKGASSISGRGPQSSRHQKSSKHHKKKHSHDRGRKRKGKGVKGKRKYVITSSSSSSFSSNDSTDSDSPNSDHIKRMKTSVPSQAAITGKDDKNSALFDIFRRYYSKLEIMTGTCVHTITSILFSNNLISEDVQDQVITGQESDGRKASKVLYSVKQRLKVDPEILRKFVDVLHEEQALDDLTRVIKSDILSLDQEAKATSPQRAMPIISRYREYLKDIYCRDPIARDDKLFISPCGDFISLALIKKEKEKSTPFHDPFTVSTLHGGVDEIIATKTPLEIDALVTPGSQFILVEGPPGIGKSTLCWELCRKWESLKSLQDFKVVLHLKLRERRVQNLTSLHEVFYNEDKKLCDGVVDWVLNCRGERVLLILDGFDEMPGSVIDAESSLIMRLIRRECLPKAICLLTSRPSALHHKDSCFPREYRHVEILGFTDEHKIQFAQDAFKSEPEILIHFKHFIFSNPIITSLMYIPVNCAIIAQVYKELPDITVPKTMTELYTLLVLVLIRRHLIQTGRWSRQSKVPANLEGLPEDIKADLMKVSELAYNGLMKEDVQVMFTDEDVAENFQHLGLLNEAKEMYVLKGATSYYSFLHLSIQEFLGAWHVSCHPEKLRAATSGLSDAVCDNIKPHLIAFGRFLSGMCSTSFDTIHTIMISEGGLYMNLNNLYLVSCCYEAQNASCLSTLTRHIITLGSPLDMYLFGYALVHASAKWTVTASASFEMLVSSLSDHAPDGRILGRIGKLTCGIGATGVESLPEG